MPKVDYLPYIKRDAIDVFVSIPPGQSKDKLKQSLADYINGKLMSEDNRHFKIKNYYVLVFPGGSSIGIRLENLDKVPDFMDYLKNDLFASYKDANAIVFQGALLGRFGGGRSIEVNLTNKNLSMLNNNLDIVSEAIKEKLPSAIIQVTPNLDIPDPLLRVSPNMQIIQQSNIPVEQVGRWIQTMGNGWFIGEFFDGSERHRVFVKGPQWQEISQLQSTPVLSPERKSIMLGELVNFNMIASYSNIRRVNGERAFTLAVIPPDQMTMSEATEILQTLETSLSKQLDHDTRISIGGNSRDFEQLLDKFTYVILIALISLFLVSYLTFNKLSYAGILMLNLPLCFLGGIIGYQVLALFVPQTFNLIVLFGFVILIGIVVNNIILLIDEVDRKNHEMDITQAITSAIQIRGPIVNISAFTTIVGLLPMVLSPAAGSELYQGLAAVVMGGMLISLLCTYLVTPFLIQFVHSFKIQKNKEVSSDVLY
jgi:multidrug efflux pump subunit AcrB